MADARDDGGQAFPGVQTDGMSLRDYFAGQALAGQLASFGPDDFPNPDGLAALAYCIADAVLAERSK